MLRERFKRFRRTKKRATSTTPTQSVTAKKKKKLGSATTIPPGEDESSYWRHVKALKAEYAKTRPNKVVVQQLMKLSFPIRRNRILETPMDVSTIMDECPFLSDYSEVCQIYGHSMHIVS